MEQSSQYGLRKRADIPQVEMFQVEGTPAVKPVKRYLCPVCSAECKTQQALQRHSVTHAEERPHVCHQCQRSFKREDSLTYHKRVFHEYRTFPRKYMKCEKFFSGKGAYDRHQQKAHNSSSSFKQVKTGDTCDLCWLNEQGKYDAVTPRHHMIRHTDQVFHQCLICWKTYKKCTPHIKHQFDHYYQRNWNPEMKYIVEPTAQCDVCLLVLSSKQALQRHTSKLHA